MKIKVASGGMSFYVTAAAVKRGVGDNASFNEAVRQCYDSLKRWAKADSIVVGQAGSWNGYSLQMDFIKE